MNAVVTFTAAQIAAALGKAGAECKLPRTKRGVLASLRDVPATSRIVNGGPAAQAWSLESLPQRFRDAFATIAKERDYRDAEHLLLEPIKAWRPAWPLAEVAQHCLDKATKVQRALSRVLSLQTDLSRTSAEVERLGLEDYRSEFGYTITDRALRSLIKRTIARDGGAENWNRLELYLDERPARKTPLPSAPVRGSQSDFPELRDVLATFKDQAAPTDSEKEYLWLRAFEIYDERTNAGEPEKKTLRAIARFLFASVPAFAKRLAKHEIAFRKKFRRKHARWIANDRRVESLADRRADKSGNFRAKPFLPDDVRRISYEAADKHRNRMLPAVRKLCERGELKDPMLIAWGVKGCDPSSSIYRRLLEVVTPQKEAVRKYVLDPNANRRTRPHMDLDKSKTPSMKAVVVDDFTLPVRVRVPDGQGWWRLTRGQCILVTDYSTDPVLSFGIQEEEQPNSLIARTTLVRAFQKHGVPEILVVERGKVFADSALVTGGERARNLLRVDAPFSDAEVSIGLRRFCEVRVSRHPRSKPIERVGDLVQQLMTGEPGFTGIEEKYDLPHETKHWTQELARRNPKALEHFYTMEEWRTRLEQIFFKEYNHKCRGKRTVNIPGLTPLEAFQQRWQHDDPPRKLPPELRFMLSHHKVENVPVTDNGVRLTIRGKTYRYFDDQTGHWQTYVGKKVTAWLDPEAPDFCTFTDAQMRNAFTVPRHDKIVPFDFGDSYQAEQDKSWAHANVGKRLYSELKAQPWATFRRPIASTPEPIQLAQEITEQQARAEARRADEKKRQTRVSRRARALGIRPGLVENSERSQSALELMAEARREHESEQAKGEL